MWSSAWSRKALTAGPWPCAFIPPGNGVSASAESDEAGAVVSKRALVTRTCITVSNQFGITTSVYQGTNWKGFNRTASTSLPTKIKGQGQAPATTWESRRDRVFLLARKKGARACFWNSALLRLVNISNFDRLLAWRSQRCKTNALLCGQNRLEIKPMFIFVSTGQQQYTSETISVFYKWKNHYFIVSNNLQISWQK